MLRLKGQTDSGEWMEFWVHDSESELTVLREQVKVLREALEEARAAANHVHTACIDPNRPRQSIGEIAHHLVTTLDVLSQTKPKDEREAKL